MTWSGPLFVILIIAISTAGWLISTWIRARHGYPIENEWSGMTYSDDGRSDRKVDELSQENAALKDHVRRLEDRLKVLERIATDESGRIEREIEKLR